MSQEKGQELSHHEPKSQGPWFFWEPLSEVDISLELGDM